MKLDHLCGDCLKHSAGGFGTLDALTLDDGVRTGPISLRTALGPWLGVFLFAQKLPSPAEVSIGEDWLALHGGNAPEGLLVRNVDVPIL
jgi:hypothetical protein